MADTINDLMYKYYSALVTGTSSLFGAINVSRAAVGVEATTSVTGDGSVTSPGADVAIAATPDLSSGTWEIEIHTFITGTTVATLESSNMKFKIGGTVISTIVNPVPGTVGANSLGVYRIRVNLGATGPVSVASGVAGTVNSIYKATIVASKIGF